MTWARRQTTPSSVTPTPRTCWKGQGSARKQSLSPWISCPCPCPQGLFRGRQSKCPGLTRCFITASRHQTEQATLEQSPTWFQSTSNLPHRRLRQQKQRYFFSRSDSSMHYFGYFPDHLPFLFWRYSSLHVILMFCFCLLGCFTFTG